MVAITATNSATPSVSVSIAKVKLEQARNEADKAESTARSLRAQVNVAEQNAQAGQTKVRKLSASVNPEAVTYASPLEKGGTEVPIKTQDFLVNVYNATNQKRAESGNSLKANTNAAPVINSQGQATGRIVNVSA
jgi:uncharacterized protein YkwD